MTNENTVAVIGGGLQGCLAALALAARGIQVTIFERRDRLLQGASRSNEGKIHAGFTYALDPSGETIDLLSRHAADFQPLLSGLLNRDPRPFVRHHRTVYAMHRDSLLSIEAADEHFRRVDSLWLERSARWARCGHTSAEPSRRWSAVETRGAFGRDVLGAYEVSETVIDPDALCEAVASAIEADPRISVETSSRVARVEQGDRLALIARDGVEAGTADYVVNCAWEDLPGITQRSGGAPRGLCLRAKAAFIARAEGQLPYPLTISFGPFGDVVPIGTDRVYLSWYPACLAGFTTDREARIRGHLRGGVRRDVLRSVVTRAVTICVPAYRAETFLHETVESALAQTWPDVRIVISVDPSSDRTAALARAMARDRRISIVTHKRRIGWIANTNAALARVNTPFGMILPHDDILHPDYVERCVSALQGDPGAVAAFSDIETFGDRSIPLMEPPLAGTLLERVTSFVRDHFAAVAFRAVFDAARVSSRAVPSAIGGFAADSVWVGRMACYGNLLRVAEPLYRKRLHAASAHERWKVASDEELDDMWIVHCAELAMEIARTRPELARNQEFWGAVRDRLHRKGASWFRKPGTPRRLAGAERPLREMLRTYSEVELRRPPYSWMSSGSNPGRRSCVCG